MTRFPTYPKDILDRADALLSEKYPDGIVDPRFVEIACEAMMSTSDWQPIETAPAFAAEDENIQRLLLWVADGGPDRNGDVDFGWVNLSARTGKRTPKAASYSNGWTITHWQPLPAPPIAKAIRGTK